MSDLIQALRPTVINRNVTTSSFSPNVASIAEQIQAREVPYCYLIHKENKEALINLNCQLLHIYHYIREKFAGNEVSIGLVNADKATFLDLKNQSGYAYNHLESKGTYLLVKVIHLNQQTQNEDGLSTMSQLNVNSGIPTQGF